MENITLSNEQNTAVHNFFEWFNCFNAYSKKFYFLAGYAGTGKTTLCKFIIDELTALNKSVCCCAFTGKAACNFFEKTGHPCNTIHSTIYTPRLEEDEVIDWDLNFEDSPILNCDLIIIDEVSMIYQGLWNDLLKYHTPILVFGDPYQLPPVNNDVLFGMDSCDFVLEHIHRQALDNPLIQLSMQVRQEKNIPFGNFNDKVIKCHIRDFDRKQLTEFDQVICGRNITRQTLNKEIRKLLNYCYTIPAKGEKLICLRNNKKMNVFNGLILTTLEDIISFDSQNGTFDILLDYNGVAKRFTIFDDEFSRKSIRADRWKILTNKPEICQFDFSYAISCHKSQGSEWSNVCVFDESNCFKADKFKWLYTAITRAKDRLVIVA